MIPTKYSLGQKKDTQNDVSLREWTSLAQASGWFTFAMQAQILQLCLNYLWY